MNLIIFLIRAYSGLCFLGMAAISLGGDVPKYNPDFHPNPEATVASILLATLYLWPLIAEARKGGVVARKPKAKSFTPRRFLTLGRWFVAFMFGMFSVIYFYELHFGCGTLSLIAVAWLTPPLDRLAFMPRSELSARLNGNSALLKFFPNLGALSIFIAFCLYTQQDFVDANYTFIFSISLLLVVPIVLLVRGGRKALSLKPIFAPAVIQPTPIEISVSKKVDANCALCSRRLHFLNTPNFGLGKLKDGGILCTKCTNKISWVRSGIALKLNKYTLREVKSILQEKAPPPKLLAEKQKSVSPTISSPAPQNYNVMQMKDVFICHASEDKRMFIEPLITELVSSDISCWYDNAEIKWGDSIVKKVNQGLSSSRFVLVAISMNSIKKHWPNAELEASINMEFSAGKTKVLPLLIGNEEEIKSIVEHYPILRSKLYVNYAIGVKEISRLLKERIIINDAE